jgi:large subunit ribosomal protein L7Ae
MAKSYVKFSVPAPMQAKALEVVSLAKGGGVLRKGTNEATKAIERSEAKIVIIAEDVDPEEIVMHLPILCAEKNVPYTYVASKLELGKAAGINVPTAAIAVCKPAAGEDALRELLIKVRELLPSNAPAPKAAPADKAAKKPAAPKKAKEKTEAAPAAPAAA